MKNVKFPHLVISSHLVTFAQTATEKRETRNEKNIGQLSDVLRPRKNTISAEFDNVNIAAVCKLSWTLAAPTNLFC